MVLPHGTHPEASLITETRAAIEEGRALREESLALCDELNEKLMVLKRTISETQARAGNEYKPASSLTRLTKRECAVLTLIAGGHSSKQVAAFLGISFKTAVCHRTHIMEKLDIHETAGLTRFAVRCGLIRA